MFLYALRGDTRPGYISAGGVGVGVGVGVGYSRAPVGKGDSCVSVRLARGYTPRLHLNVVAEHPGNPVCFTQVKVTGVSPAYFAQVKIPGRESSRGSIRG